MRKIYLPLLFVIICSTAFAQTVDLTFTGRDGIGHHVQLNKVIITNHTKSWQETIYWPDTVLTMQNGTGINDYTENGCFALYQNGPNPFTNYTDVNLMVSEEETVTMEITDVSGRTIQKNDFFTLPGTHKFLITLSTAGIYILTARQNGQVSSIKMVCNGSGNTNKIDHLGQLNYNTYTKSITNHPFNYGDMMEYVGFATINGAEFSSQYITQAQSSSQILVLQFTEIQCQLPIVITDTVSDVSGTSATCGGSVINDGGCLVSDRGVCWSESPNPTTNSPHSFDGNSTGSFSSSIINLTGVTTYYVRAYATNSAGTSYGEQRSFVTLISPPRVMISSIINVTTVYACCVGSVYADGGDSVTTRGVCWSTLANPTLNDYHSICGSGTGVYTCDMTNLTPGTTYYVRPFASNSAGTAYGNEVTVTTIGLDGYPCPNANTVTDYDGNIYNTVKLGNQCWMKENLRTTHCVNGTPIGNGNGHNSNESYTHPYYFTPYWVDISIYGHIYNWRAIQTYNTGGICPTGWHVPSQEEVVQLMTYISSQSQYACGNENWAFQKAFASTTGWQYSSRDCAIGNNQSTNNATGFSALPAGCYTYDYYSDGFENMGKLALFWESTPVSGACYDSYGCNRCFGYTYDPYANIGTNYLRRTDAASVRCLRN